MSYISLNKSSFSVSDLVLLLLLLPLLPLPRHHRGRGPLRTNQEQPPCSAENFPRQQFPAGRFFWCRRPFGANILIVWVHRLNYFGFRLIRERDSHVHPLHLVRLAIASLTSCTESATRSSYFSLLRCGQGSRAAPQRSGWKFC